MNKTFDDYYYEAITKPKEEARARKVERITGSIIKYIIITTGSLLILKEIF